MQFSPPMSHGEYRTKQQLPQVTPRSVAAGLFIGSLVLVSNFQFGLQTGWVSMMSLPSALLAFAVFKALASRLSYPFTDVENVFVQSVAVSVGTGPLAYGFVGIIPAMEKFLTADETGLGRQIRFSVGELVVWAVGLGFFGIFFAIPLRKQVVVKEKLPFPSGAATATLISVLHNTAISESNRKEPQEEEDSHESKHFRQHSQQQNGEAANDQESPVQERDTLPRSNAVPLESQSSLAALQQLLSYRKNIRTLVVTFTISSVYTVVSYFVPLVRSLPVFGWSLSANHLWNFQPSPAYIGQGIIMGLPTTSYMLFGAVLGWGVLAPLVQYLGWVSGPIGDWKTGAQGWILWVSLSVMVSDSVVSFFAIVAKSLLGYYYRRKLGERIKRRREQHNTGADNHESEALISSSGSASSSSDEDDRNATYHGQLAGSNRNTSSTIEEIEIATFEEDLQVHGDDVDDEFLVSQTVTIGGIVISTLVCVVAVNHLFPAVALRAVLFAVGLAFFLSVLAVRALGETDLNPVSGIGKLSQLALALVVPSHHPASLLASLVAGGIAEAGAQQAGDLTQDLKTGHLLGASPRAQFHAQLLGTVWSVVLSAVMYRVYDYVYDIPNDLFRIPTAVIWVDCARLVTGRALPDHVFAFAAALGVLFGLIALLKNTLPPGHRHYSKLKYLPSGVPVGVGLYNAPSFTLARFLGGVAAYVWMKRRAANTSHDRKVDMIIFSSGLVLGEGIFSIANMAMENFGVPHF